MEIKKILAIRNDRFGEFLLIIPALRALKKTYPQAAITLAVDRYLEHLAAAIDVVDEVIIWEKRKHSFIEIFKFAGFLRKSKYNVAIIFNSTKDSHLLTFLAAIPIRIGYNRKWPFLLTRRLVDKKHLGDKHEVEYNIQLISSFIPEIQEHNHAITVSESARKSLRQKLKTPIDKSTIVVHPWTSDPIKQWSPDNFRKLVQQLCSDSTRKIVVIGSNVSEEKQFIFEGISVNVINMINKTDLLELAVILKDCGLLISCDSGPVHLAASVNTKVISIFRNDIPGKTANRWRPWGQGHIVIEKKSLSLITVEDVLKEVYKVIPRN
ncbi:MAG: glycosyltransferase family 9 protein [Candidatus Omnitrophica bacterium]|nr:glycosyltransferase family 9 protein [Candidatus Omnitrophota bacterium]